jgi:predicted phosphodiesterase
MKNFLFIMFCLLFSNKLIAKNYEQNYEKYWVQYSDQNSLLFRQISTQSKQCPIIKVDNVNVKTQERIHEYKNEFPIKVCQAEIENNKQHLISFKNLNVTTKIENINKISVLGDTGCITEGKAFEQSCYKLEEYPFSEVAKNVEHSKADLIIHVGDYFYSKEKCINDDKCKNRSYGDKLDTWKVDFLDNGSKFFYSSPIIFARGNHESCKRGGKGWFTMLDPSINFRKCSDFTDPYTIDLKNIRFSMLDSTFAPDSKNKFNELSKIDKKNTLNKYQEQIDYVLSRMNTDKQNVLITHKPIFSKEFRLWQDRLLFEANYLINKVINKSKYKNNLNNLELILSGHTHTGMLIEFKNKNYHFYQVVSGNGGAFLNNANMLKQSDKYIFDKKIAHYFEYKDFGYSELYFNNKERIEKIGFFKYDGKLVKENKFYK